MIIKEFQLSEIIKKSSLPQFLLIYGPNEGLIRNDILKITESFRQKKKQMKLQYMERQSMKIKILLMKR